MSKTIKIGKQYRSFSITKEDIKQDKRSVSLSFSSENPVERWFGIEILDHNKDAVDLRRLKRGGALLIDHNSRDQVGVIEEVLIDEADRKGRATVRFGRSAKAEEIFQDVVDGIRTNVSVGYMVHEMKLEKEDKGGDTYRVTRWEPLEISIVSIPADIEVGVGRSEEEIKEVTITERRSEMLCPHCKRELLDGAPCECRKATPQPVNAEDVRAETRKLEINRVREINAIGDTHKCLELARKHIEAGTAIEEFRKIVLEEVYKRKILAIEASDPEIGMSGKEIRQYSIIRALRKLANLETLDGLEKESSDAVAKLCRREPKGFFIPHEVITSKRSLSVGDAAKAGYTVGTDVLGSSMIELLRNKPRISQLGARTLSGLVGNILIPRITGGATAYWLPEAGSGTATDQSFGQLALSPKRLVGDTAYSKELLMQSSIDIEAFVREDLMTVLAIEKDRAAVNGLGANGEPLGIINTTGIKTMTFGAAATWAKVIDFETQIADANAIMESLAYLTAPAVRGKWKSTPKVTNQAIFLWENDVASGTGMVNGYRAEATKQVPSDKVIFGNWADMIFAEWAGIDVVVDPYSLKKTGQIEVTITLWTDIGIRHAVSFCVSTDSGAQ